MKMSGVMRLRNVLKVSLISVLYAEYRHKGNRTTQMTRRLILGLMMGIAVSACSTIPGRGEGEKAKEDTIVKVDKTIADTATSVQKLMAQLVDAEAGVKRQSPANGNLLPSGLSYTVTISWNGDIERVLSKLAEYAKLDYQVIGRPVTPVLVSIHVQNVPMEEALRQLGIQMGSLGDIVYVQSKNRIELRYASR